MMMGRTAARMRHLLTGVIQEAQAATAAVVAAMEEAGVEGEIEMHKRAVMAEACE